MFINTSLSHNYLDIPEFPREQLIRFVCDLLETPQGLAKVSAILARPADETVPEDLLDELTQLVDPKYPDSSAAWFIVRAHLRANAPLDPPLPVNQRQIVERWSDVCLALQAGEGRFALVNLKLDAANDLVLQHAFDHADELEVASLVGRSAAVEWPVELLVACVPPVLEEALTDANLTESGSLHLSLHSNQARFAGTKRDMELYEPEWARRRLLASALTGPHALEVLPRCPAGLPARVYDDIGILCGFTDGDEVVLAGGHRMARKEFNAPENAPCLDVFALDRLRDRDWRTRLIVDAATTPLIEHEPDLTLRRMADVIERHPAFAKPFSRRLRELDGAPSQESLARCVARCPDFLWGAAEAGWVELLCGEEAYVSIAEAHPDAKERLQLLAHIGAPALAALQRVVDDDLNQLAENIGVADPHDVERYAIRERLVWCIDNVPALGLPFWFNRLKRRGALRAFAISGRLRTALQLQPTLIHGLVERRMLLTTREVLHELLMPLAAIGADLTPVAEDLLHLVIRVDESEEKTNDWEPLHVLVLMDHPDARKHLRSRLTKGEVPAWVLGMMCTRPYTYAALSDWGVITPERLIERLRIDLPVDQQVPPYKLCARAAAEVLDAFLKRLEGTPDDSLEDPDLTLLYSIKSGCAGVLTPVQNRKISECWRRFLPPNCVDDPEPAQPVYGPWHELHPDDFGVLLPQIGAWYAERVMNGVVPSDIRIVLRRAMVAVVRRHLGEAVAAHFAADGSPWATRAALQVAAAQEDVEVDTRKLDRCADEGLPPVFRAAVTRLLNERVHVDKPGDISDLVEWVFRDAWGDAPELLARHLLPELNGADTRGWRLGLAVVLVALREPVGTAVPDALTRLAHAARSEPARAELLAQRDAFARDAAGAERAKGPRYRTRQALLRLRRQVDVYVRSLE